jgi:putative membrane protein
MNPVRNVNLTILVLAFAAGCGGTEPTPMMMPDVPPAEPTTPPAEMAAPAEGTGSGHEGHDMSGAGAAAPATAGATSPGGAPGSAGDTGSASAATLSDEQILQVVHVANLGEVEQAKIAQQKAKNAKAKAFAGMMVKDHADADAKGAELAKKNKLTPSDSPISTTLKADSDKTVEQLKAQTGAEFDRAYMEAQVKAHQTVLDAIDSKLLPSAKNAELKTMLQGMRPKIEGHLKEAQEIQKALGATK